MRITYLVCYDISDDRRLRQVHKFMLGFGERVQYSVFFCDLSDSEKILMFEGLHPLINHREDKVMIVRLGPADGRLSEHIETLGVSSSLQTADRKALIF
ncbi:CRISPR-associated endonuclease Cas2 [bacterium]|nr:CRISPR-associated endonuclease Cas2 [bacterium]